jgi:hypothetical protein
VSAKSIVSPGTSLEPIRAALREAPLVAIRQELTDERILDACAGCGHDWRERLYGPVVTVLHFVAQALQREASFAATWQELWAPVAAAFPEVDPERLDPSALTHARGRLPKEALQSLADEACARSVKYAAPTWKGLRLKALDCSTVSMPREKELFGHFGAHRARSTTVRYPLATCAFLLEVGSSLALGYRFGPFDPGEMRTAGPLLQMLGVGDLLLSDRHFAGTPQLHAVRTTGAHFLMRKNARLIVERLPVIQRLGHRDFITEIPVSTQVRNRHPGLPPTVRVRIFRATWKSPDGRKLTDWFVTSLEDAQRFKPRTLAKLYHLRWRVETSYLEFKQTFHADVLRSKTVANIEKEFAAHVLAYQLVRLLMAQAARKHRKKPTEISTLNAARWLLSFSPLMAAAPDAKLPRLYERLLDLIASSQIDIRPGRLEPRALTREWKHYPRLRISRAQWRAQLLQGAS